MAYIGNKLADSYTSFAKQDFTTSATTSYTLDNAVTNENEIALFINFVRQEPTTAYTASGTTLTLSSATSASDDMYCVFLGKALQTVNPPAGSVGTSQLASGAVTAAKLDSGVALGKVLQVVTATDTTQRSTSSTSYVTGSNTLTVDITPSSTSNKIFLIVHSSMSAGASQQSSFTIFRDSTNLGNSTYGFTGNIIDNGDAHNTPFAMTFLDSPSSTSSLTYQVYFKSHGSYTTSMNMNGATGCITVMEIAG